ncbi:hypothetical protein [Naasia sp. SYSU D00057]|uniref:hypothetical protein n=1 Tax=Naasia sp. SYSU D00057 TaxID=2817380 RepID=UPI001B30A83B|nr:hypothetical protein [Naasia sp. SYSU D00057]
MRSRRADEAGTVAAELAAAMPAVLLVLALCLGALQALTQRAVLADGAASAARAIARGDPAPRVPRGVTSVEEREGDMLCVTLSAAAPLALGLNVSGRACALGTAW